MFRASHVELLSESGARPVDRIDMMYKIGKAKLRHANQINLHESTLQPSLFIL